MKTESTPTRATNVIWRPQRGSQERFLSCSAFEVLYGGTRGPGKTDALLMDFAQYVHLGKGWRGILFRQTYKQLEEVIAKTYRWFPQIFPDAEYKKGNFSWHFASGAELKLRHMENESGYWNYHGHEYPWIGWEELTNWPTLDCYESMKSCCRSSYPGLPRHYRATCNPFGIGHNAVKRYFIDSGSPIVTHTNDEGKTLSYEIKSLDPTGHPKFYIHGNVYENIILQKNDPNYIKRTLEGIINENKRKAWLYGDWDITAGGAIDDVWDRAVHVMQPFKIPSSWFVDRSFDWGSAKPFSVGWWAESDGTTATMADGTTRHFPRRTLFRIGEWYGCEPNKDDVGIQMTSTDIGKGIYEREKNIKEIYDIKRIAKGPADASIFDRIDDDCIADKVSLGYRKAAGSGGDLFFPANKSAGTRRNGLDLLRTRLSDSLQKPMEKPGLFIFNTCKDWLRTVPVIPRCEKDPEDVDTKAEDHAYDETRYRIITQRSVVSSHEFLI